MRFFAIADFLDSKRFDEKSKRSTGEASGEGEES